jgi:hypothetical protein
VITLQAVAGKGSFEMSLSKLREWKYLILLLAMIAMAVFQPMTKSVAGRGAVLHDLLSMLPLLVVFVVVFTRHWERIVASCAGVVAIAFLLVHYLVRSPEHTLFQIAFETVVVLFSAFAVYVILRNIFQKQSVHVDDVIGSVCGYMLAATAFANTYALIVLVTPDAFNMSPDMKTQLADWNGSVALFRYFSFVTLTTVGFGDITPIRPPATTLVWLEALFGQFYVAIVVAQLVAVRLTQAMEARKPPEQ